MSKKIFMKNVVAMIAIIAMITCGALVGCVDNIKNSSEEEGKGDAPNEFNFSMKKTVEFTLKYDVPTGYRVHFEMYSKSPLTLDEYKSYVKDSTLIPFLSGRADENGKISFKGELPSTVSEIYAYSTAIGVPVLLRASVSDAGIVSDFKIAEVTGAKSAVSGTKSTRATLGASGTTFWKTYNVTLANPTLPQVSMTISQEDKNLIDKSFPENQNYDIVQSYYQSAIQLNQKASVKIYSVKHGANSNRTNALAYFVYKNKDAAPDDVNSTLQMAFPELNNKVPAEGSGYQLLNNGNTTFEAGSYIGFALFPDIKVGNIQTTNTNVLYSCFSPGRWNTYNYPGLQRAGVPHMVMSLLRVDKDGHAIIAIGFEDQPFSYKYGTNKGNFRDDMFIVEVDPASSLPGDLPTPPTENPDYDNEYTTSGILCFEDCWPHAGDYDINDVTIAYERSLLMHDKNGLVGLKEKFTFLNNGAAYTNGFGYQLLGLSQSDIKKCTIESDYQWSEQGLDATAASEEAIIMLFDNGQAVKPGTTFNVTTYFSPGATMMGVNPFIVVKKESGIMEKNRIEVHLPTTSQSSIMTRFLPTSKANTTYFGQFADKSDPKKKNYYVRMGNYPFALDINWESSKHGEPTNFKIPRETKNIDYSYPDFTKWVDSNGKTNKDWYLSPSSTM